MDNTMDYMKLLEESNKINDDLDHVSFDSKKSLLSAKLPSQLNETNEELRKIAAKPHCHHFHPTRSSS